MVGAALVLLATAPLGPGLGPDSAVYLEGARNIAAGNGFVAPGMGGVTVPVVHWPPLFSFLLSLFIRAGIDPIEGGRWLNALCHGATAALAGWSAWRLCGKPAAAWLAALPCAAASGLLSTDCWLLSESLFTLLALACAVALAGAVRTGRLRWLVLSAALAGLACLQRYAGLFLLGAAPVALLALGSGNWKARARDAGLWLLPAALPYILWSVRNKLVAGQASTRVLDLHVIPLTHWKDAASVVSKWLLPPEIPWQVRGGALLLLMLVLLGAGVLALRNWRHSVGWPAGVWCLLFSGTYVALLLTNIALFDQTTPLDSRTLSPLIPGLAAVLVAGALSATKYQRVLLGGILLLALGSGARLPGVMGEMRAGLGYAAPQWTGSPLIAALRELPPDVPVWTNRSDVVRLHTGRAAMAVPSTHHANALRPEDWPTDERYAGRAAEMRDEIRAAGGCVAYFKNGWEFYAPLERTMQDLDLEIEREFSDGWLLKPRAGRHP